VAAWRSSAATFSLNWPTIPCGDEPRDKCSDKRQSAAPTATGPAMRLFGAGHTGRDGGEGPRMHSSPSRKTSTPISRKATVGLVLGRQRVRGAP